jgi:hypothetical protein
LGGGRPVQAALVQLEADIPVKRHTRYVCLDLIDLAIGEQARSYGQKHELELHPSGKELAIFASNFSINVHVNLDEKVLRRDHIDELRGSNKEPQPANEGSSSD